jgi:DNA-directed RNA polymerase alpha subunit
MERFPIDPADAARPISAESGLEVLGLPVRARNALRAAGCETVSDVLRLDLAAPIRGLGRKAKDELLERLTAAGFSHPGEELRATELSSLERSLEKIEERVDGALAAIAKELRLVRHRLRRIKETPRADPKGM